MKEATYKVLRMYFNEKKPTEIIRAGLSLEEARSHCRNPETSSRHATSEEAAARTYKYGPWFDGYEKEGL